MGPKHPMLKRKNDMMFNHRKSKVGSSTTNKQMEEIALDIFCF
jgi:hypothetical protein